MAAPSPVQLSIVSPVYRAKGCIVALVERITQAVLSIPAAPTFEIVLVEDCGRDGSWELMQALMPQNPHLHCLQLSRNFGQHAAITAGLDACRGDWVVVMDCDLQDRPEEIPRLWAEAHKGWAVVNARRNHRQDPWRKRLTSWMFHAFFEWLSGLRHDPAVGNFRIINRQVVDACRSMRETARNFAIHVHWLGFPTAHIEVEHAARHEGKSSYTLLKLLTLACETSLSFSNKPLRMTVGLGVLIACGALLLALYFVWLKLAFNTPVDGWSSLIVSVWFIGGLIIATLGMLGLYIGRIYDETKGRPLYAVAHRLPPLQTSVP